MKTWQEKNITGRNNFVPDAQSLITNYDRYQSCYHVPTARLTVAGPLLLCPWVPLLKQDATHTAAVVRYGDLGVIYGCLPARVPQT